MESANPRLGGEMDDGARPYPRDERREGVRLRNVETFEAKTLAPLKLRQAGALERDVIIIVEIIDADDLLATVQ